jgi:hypothetical protein
MKLVSTYLGSCGGDWFTEDTTSGYTLPGVARLTPSTLAKFEDSVTGCIEVICLVIFLFRSSVVRCLLLNAFYLPANLPERSPAGLTLILNFNA